MIAAVSTSKAIWFLMRGSGIVSLLLLTVSVVLGVSTAVRWTTPRWPRFIVEGLHKNASLLSMVFLAVHIGTALVDKFVTIRWIDVLVPFVSAYQPLWLGLGAIAVDLLLALTITSMLRVYVGPRVWRGVHWLAYLSWPVAVVHALGIGSDRAFLWMRSIAGVALLAVVVVVGWRLVTAVRGRGQGRPLRRPVEAPRPALAAARVPERSQG